MLLQVTAICVGYQSELQRLGDEGSAPAVVGNTGGHERILADCLHRDTSELIDRTSSRDPSGASAPRVVNSVPRELFPLVMHCLRLQQPVVYGDVVESLSQLKSDSVWVIGRMGFMLTAAGHVRPILASSRR